MWDYDKVGSSEFIGEVSKVNMVVVYICFRCVC